ncbi:dihydrofolate reductase family protein [Streptomyces monticola]|uniref:Dihydrofolate reductase family protein n=1 Tax=Streptomyces monticola TaxID=2666263 RepID=A0ABW2JCW7_9ACTN
MAKLIYSVIASLDGFVEDASGAFDWAVPDDETHAFINGLERPVGTYLYGRRMYEVMAAWESAHDSPGRRPVMREFARLWQAAEKVVYSRTLSTVSTARTRIEHDFDPETVRELKDSATAELSVSGPDLATHAFAAGLVDECHLFVAPVVVGGGKRVWPDGIRLPLELLDERPFGGGMVYLRYGARG